MIQKIEQTPQLDMFKTPLKHFIKESHQLVLLTKRIDWGSLEEQFSKFYCINNGRPAIPIRTLAGILLLKRMYDESDQSVIERWVENPY